MQNNKVSYRYALALFSLAKEKNLQNSVLIDCEFILSEFNKTEELFTIIKNPTINKAIKKNLFTKVFSQNIQPITMDFISLLLKKGRESILPAILEKYNSLHNKEKNIIVAELISSKKLENSLVETIKDKLSVLGSVTLKKTLNPQLIGGAIIKIGDLLYDASVKKQIMNDTRTLKL